MLFFVLADGVTEVLGEGLDLSQDQVTLSGQWRVGPQWWRSATRGGFSPSIPQGSNSESQGDQEFVVQKMESGRGGQTRRSIHSWLFRLVWCSRESLPQAEVGF